MVCVVYVRLIIRDELELCGVCVKVCVCVLVVIYCFYLKFCYVENVFIDLFGLIRLVKCVLVLFKLGMLGLVILCNWNRGYSVINFNGVSKKKINKFKFYWEYWSSSFLWL